MVRNCNVSSIKQFSETLFSETEEKGRENLLPGFEKITLSEMNRVELLNRFDSKYIMDTGRLMQILEAIKEHYFVLEAAGTTNQYYRTIYFDMPNNRFFLDHHNGIAARVKVRKREYVDSDLAFLEIKRKNNKGKTNKIRMGIERMSMKLSENEMDFIQEHMLINPEQLIARSDNRFERITLVGKDFRERCTIDTNLKFNSFWNGACKINDFVVVELKQEQRNLKSRLSDVLKGNRVYRHRFSKYCMGRVFNEALLKKNLFKEDIMEIRKKYSVVTE